MQPGGASTDSRKRKLNRTSFDESDVEIDSSASLPLSNGNTPASLPNVKYSPGHVQAQMYRPGIEQESDRGYTDLDIEPRKTTAPAQDDPTRKKAPFCHPRANNFRGQKHRKQQEIKTSLHTDHEAPGGTTTVAPAQNPHSQRLGDTIVNPLSLSDDEEEPLLNQNGADQARPQRPQNASARPVVDQLSRNMQPTHSNSAARSPRVHATQYQHDFGTRPLPPHDRQHEGGQQYQHSHATITSQTFTQGPAVAPPTSQTGSLPPLQRSTGNTSRTLATASASRDSRSTHQTTDSHSHLPHVATGSNNPMTTNVVNNHQASIQATSVSDVPSLHDMPSQYVTIGYPPAGQHPPIFSTMREAARQYPNSLYGLGLDPALQLGWTASKLFLCLPPEAVAMYRARDCEDKLGPIQRALSSRIRQLEAAGKYEALLQQPKKLRQDGREDYLKLKSVSFNIITGKAPWPTAANATAIPAPPQASTAVAAITAATAPVASSVRPPPASVQQSTGSARRAPDTNAATLAAASTDTLDQNTPDSVDAGGAVPGADLVKTLIDEVAYFKGEVEGLRDELADTEARCEAKIQELEAKYQARIQELEAKYKAKIQELEDDVEDMGCKLEGQTKTREDAEEKMEKMKKELQQLKEKMSTE